MQEIIIIFIGIATFAYVGWKVYKLFVTKQKPTNIYCQGCSGCVIMQKEIKKSPHKCVKI
jgi:hypothetical protein